MKKYLSLFSVLFLAICALNFKFSVSLAPKMVSAVGDTIPPVVTITNPVSGSNLIAGSQINIAATVTDDVGVSDVSFYVDGSLLCSYPNDSYTCPWSITYSVGTSHMVNVKAHDYSYNLGQSYSFVFVVGDTIAPTVSLTNPLNGSNVSAGSIVNIGASAVDNIGVSRVEFYVDGALNCTDTTAPYSCNWTVPNTVTSHTLTAKAYDMSSNFSQSSVTVNAIDTTAPTVTITSPVNGGTITRNMKAVIAATSTDNIGVSRVEFYVNNVLTCTDTTFAYSCVWVVPSPKNVVYTLVAKSYDAAGNMGQNTITVTSR